MKNSKIEKIRINIFELESDPLQCIIHHICMNQVNIFQYLRIHANIMYDPGSDSKVENIDHGFINFTMFHRYEDVD